MKNTDTTDLVDLVQLALIATETGETIDRLAHRFDGDVVLDDIGMRAVPAATARRFFAERAELKSRQEAQRQRRMAEAPKRRVQAGAPAIDGASPYESMIAAEGANFSTPKAEFGGVFGNPTQELLDAEFARSNQQIADKRRQTAQRKRLVAVQEKAKEAKAKADEALKGGRS